MAAPAVASAKMHPGGPHLLDADATTEHRAQRLCLRPSARIAVRPALSSADASIVRRAGEANPRTGETVAVPARTVATFNAGKALLDKLIGSYRACRSSAINTVPPGLIASQLVRIFSSRAAPMHWGRFRTLSGLIQQEDPRGDPTDPASPEFSSVTRNRAFASHRPWPDTGTFGAGTIIADGNGSPSLASAVSPAGTPGPGETKRNQQFPDLGKSQSFFPCSGSPPLPATEALGARTARTGALTCARA